MCEELCRMKREAARALCEAKRIRRTKDLTFKEDAELCRDGHQRIEEVLKHLLVGHDGEPCPAGKRPIVSVLDAWGD